MVLPKFVKDECRKESGSERWEKNGEQLFKYIDYLLESSYFFAEFIGENSSISSLIAFISWGSGENLLSINSNNYSLE